VFRTSVSSRIYFVGLPLLLDWLNWLEWQEMLENILFMKLSGMGGKFPFFPKGNIVLDAKLELKMFLNLLRSEI